jgi:hypothetical protein
MTDCPALKSDIEECNCDDCDELGLKAPEKPGLWSGQIRAWDTTGYDVVGKWKVIALPAAEKMKKAKKEKKTEPQTETCPKCGTIYDPKHDGIVECRRCGAEGSTACCNPAGKGCICLDCEEKEE